MNQNIINFYMAASKLKSVIRTGWKEVGIPDDKIETVAEHVYGSMILALAISSEYNYKSLDLLKVFKMLIIKELTKINNEVSILSKEEETDKNQIIKDITHGLSNQDEILKLYDEAVALESNEAKFVLNITKLESDIQAKQYELEGEFTLDNAKKDIENYPEELRAEIKDKVVNASDGWILYNRKYYDNDEVFMNLSKDIQKM